MDKRLSFLQHFMASNKDTVKKINGDQFTVHKPPCLPQIHNNISRPSIVEQNIIYQVIQDNYLKNTTFFPIFYNFFLLDRDKKTNCILISSDVVGFN